MKVRLEYKSLPEKKRKLIMVVVFLVYVIISIFFVTRFFPGQNLFITSNWDLGRLVMLAGILFIFAPAASIWTVMMLTRKEQPFMMVNGDTKIMSSENGKLGTFFSSWLKILVFLMMIIVGSFVFYSSHRTSLLEEQRIANIKATLAKITPENIQDVTFHFSIAGDDQPIILDRHYFAELDKYIIKMAPTNNLGMRGDWQRYGCLDVDAGKVGKLRIFLKSRESLGGRAVANVQVVGENIAYSWNYDANDLWNWLKELPIIAQHTKGRCLQSCY